MIRAQHRWPAEKIFRVYVFRILKKHFASVSLLNKFPELDPILPTLLIPNHNTWWDGFFIYFFNETVANQTIYLMMLNEQLKKYPFFSQVGAYGINPDNPKSTFTSLKYTLELLDRPTTPKSMVCIFPQGELQSWNPREIKFKPGIDWIIKKRENAVNLVPLAIRAEFLEDQLPQLFFMADKNYILDKSSFKGLEWLTSICRKNLLNIQQAIIERQKGEILITGKSSAQKRFDQFRFR
jgi:hypothetical protein